MENDLIFDFFFKKITLASWIEDPQPGFQACMFEFHMASEL